MPAKLFDSLAAGRPILSFSQNPEVAGILERTGAGLQLGPHRPAEAARLLLDCVAALARKSHHIRGASLGIRHYNAFASLTNTTSIRSVAE